jgi:metal-dependent amidase/aminoacylase/carboxypeptidase family protein
MAILCGLAMELHAQNQNRNRNFTFQPAEEDGGAEKVLNDPKFKYNPDLPLHYIIFRTEKKSSCS